MNSGLVPVVLSRGLSRVTAGPGTQLDSVPGQSPPDPHPGPTLNRGSEPPSEWEYQPLSSWARGTVHCCCCSSHNAAPGEHLGRTAYCSLRSIPAIDRHAAPRYRFDLPVRHHRSCISSWSPPSTSMHASRAAFYHSPLRNARSGRAPEKARGNHRHAHSLPDTTALPRTVYLGSRPVCAMYALCQVVLDPAGSLSVWRLAADAPDSSSGVPATA